MAENISEVPAHELQTLSRAVSLDPSAHTCRICLCPETADSDKLVRPCDCSGTVAYIHVSCLKHWVELRGRPKPLCEICKSPLKIKSTTKTVWSLRPFLHTSSCLVFLLIIPISVVLVVILVSASQDLQESRNRSEVIGCAAGLALIALTLAVMVVCSCRTRRVYMRGVLPQIEESEQNMTASLNLR